MRALTTLLAVLLLHLFEPQLARCQYIYLDVNGDGVHTVGESLPPSGSATLDVWLNTASRRDGAPAVCSTAESLTINSYEFVLHAFGGTVSWSGFVNRVPEFTLGLGESADSAEYYNGFVSGNIRPPGLYHLASISVSVVSGAPRIEFAPAGNRQVLHTSFGSMCLGADEDNTLKLGLDWFDSDGVDAPQGMPSISAPSTVSRQEGTDMVLSADVTDTLSGTDPSLSVSGYPPCLSLSVVPSGPGRLRASLAGRPTAADVGSHQVRWIATGGGGGTVVDTTYVEITPASAMEGPVVVGYTISGDGPPPVVTNGPNGYDITLGAWTGTPFPNGPCGQLLGGNDWGSNVSFEIAVNSGGTVSFSSSIDQTGTPFMGEVMMFFGTDVFTGNTTFIGEQGNPVPCWGNLYSSPLVTRTIKLTPGGPYNYHLGLSLSGYWNSGTEVQVQVQSLAVGGCPITPLTPLSPADQAFEDQENRWDESGLTPAMSTALSCLRTKVQQVGGYFNTTEGSAYRTPGYQRHLHEVWVKYNALKNKNIPACQSLKTQLQVEFTKHKIKVAGRTSEHSLGRAFDVTITNANQDSLACECGLVRPYRCPSPKFKRVDPPHFELLRGRPCAVGLCP